MEKKIKHLEFIQNVISRQAKNSFLLKGWVITILAALFTFPPKDGAFKQIFTVYVLVFIFWMLDSYYLWQERLFRALYKHVRKLKEDKIDFDMDTKSFSKEECSWWDIVTSRTLLIFYLSLMIFTIIFFYWK